MNQLIKKTLVCLFGAGLITTQASAQLSSNPDKFLGNITTGYGNDMDTNGRIYHNYWNQVTPENASKWQSVEGTRNSYNWGGADKAFKYAKDWDFTYKFHALIWGAQYPNWLPNLSIKERYASIVKWFDAVKKHYPTLPMIDVVNEAVWSNENEPHQAGNPMMRESMGGKGKTGYDWLIRAFEMAYERWPNSILIYNDYNSIRWQIDQYITLVTYLRDAGAPIDAYGLQCHELTDIQKTECENALKKLDDALKMPMYSTEFDIGTSSDQQQLTQYKNLIPLFWEKDYCAGVTLWGWIYGSTWTTDGNSGLIKNGKERPALEWLREYMETDAAKNAKSPFPGMKKEASIYIRPRDLKVAKGDKLPIKVRASMATKTIEKVDLYVGDELIATMKEEPYVTEYAVASDAKTGWKNLKAVVTTTDGSTYERYSRFNILSSTTVRSPYPETVPTLPGTIKAEEYDKGASGVSYNKASRDITKATQNDGWMEYTVDVQEKSLYSVDVEVASTKTGGWFHLAEYSLDNLAYLTDFIEVPKTGSTTEFQTMHIVMNDTLTAGRHIICVNIDKGGFYLKSLTFNRYEQDKNIKVSIPSTSYFNPDKKSNTIELGDKAVIEVKAETSTSTIAKVKVFANDLFIGAMEEAPYTMEFEPTAKGNYVITAIAYNAEGKENMSSKRTLKVNGKREPYSGNPITIPGVIKAVNFDKGGEGLSFHDSDDNNEGDDKTYRTDSEGVDFVKGNGGTVIGYTAKNEWLEYTIDVQEAGTYSYVATVSSGTTGSGFSIGIKKLTSTSAPTSANTTSVSVPQTGNNDWGTYKTVEGNLKKDLEAGQQILRITITGDNCNIDKLELKCTSSGIHDMLYDIPVTNQKSYDLFGRRVDSNYKGIIIRNGKKYINK